MEKKYTPLYQKEHEKKCFKQNLQTADELIIAVRDMDHSTSEISVLSGPPHASYG